MSTRILVVDNYDSFVFNIVQYLAQLGAEVDVRRNDEVAPADALGYDGVLLSPGPGTPADAGVCLEMVTAMAGVRPLFGVCLGHQAIGEAYGAVVVVLLLFTLVFPWLEPRLPFNDVTVDETPTSSVAPSPSSP